MSGDPKSDEARKLISTFAAKLLALNDGKKISAAWRSHLKEALTPKPGKTGRKLNHDKFKEVVTALVRARSQRLPATSSTLKDEIASQCRVSRKTVERAIESLRELCTPGLDPPKGTDKVFYEAAADVLWQEIAAEEKSRRR